MDESRNEAAVQEQAAAVRRRQNIAQEILSTEKSYVNNLKSFTTKYLQALRDMPVEQRSQMLSDVILLASLLKITIACTSMLFSPILFIYFVATTG